ncbi:hypothetical protein Q7P35_012313 [Cladosporium inversicolor]
MQFTNMELVLNKKVDQGAPYDGGCVLSKKKVDQGAPYDGGCTLSKVDQGAPYDGGCTVSYHTREPLLAQSVFGQQAWTLTLVVLN